LLLKAAVRLVFGQGLNQSLQLRNSLPEVLPPVWNQGGLGVLLIDATCAAGGALGADGRLGGREDAADLAAAA